MLRRGDPWGAALDKLTEGTLMLTPLEKQFNVDMIVCIYLNNNQIKPGHPRPRPRHCHRQAGEAHHGVVVNVALQRPQILLR